MLQVFPAGSHFLTSRQGRSGPKIGRPVQLMRFLYVSTDFLSNVSKHVAKHGGLVGKSRLFLFMILKLRRALDKKKKEEQELISPSSRLFAWCKEIAGDDGQVL